VNSLLTPALYTLIDATPGTIEDDPGYQVNGADNVARPGCYAANYLDQQSDDHASPFWRVRDLIAEAKGATTALFMTGLPRGQQLTNQAHELTCDIVCPAGVVGASQHGFRLGLPWRTAGPAPVHGSPLPDLRLPPSTRI
jgi:hypothetical protein